MNTSFNWKQYLTNYPDLQVAGINTSKSAYRHYMTHGISEGRTDNKIIHKQEENQERVEYIEESYSISLNVVNEYVNLVIKPIINQEIIIVYYIYINPQRNWKCIISGQINDLKNIGLIPFSKLYCVICTPSINLFNECKKLINIVNANYYHITVNNYEYPGIKKLHELGTIYPEKLFFYMHSKGMVFHKNNGRNHEEIQVLRNTIKYWKYILYIFKNYSFIDKAGLFPDHSGVIWFNFFWIRGSFLKKLNPPIISSNRYYYENGYINSSENNCFNLLSYDLSRIGPYNACCILKKTGINNKNQFNWKKYITKYEDLVCFNNLNKAYSHFITCGISEFRNLI
jgi:hypothetical protein